MSTGRREGLRLFRIMLRFAPNFATWVLIIGTYDMITTVYVDAIYSGVLWASRGFYNTIRVALVCFTIRAGRNVTHRAPGIATHMVSPLYSSSGNIRRHRRR